VEVFQPVLIRYALEEMVSSLGECYQNC
jgi:hypothetical protein